MLDQHEQFQPKKKQQAFFGFRAPVSIKIIRGVLYALIFFTLINEFFLQTDIVRSETMAPTIRKGERVYISKLRYASKLPFIFSRETGKTFVYARPKRGDIVLIRDPSKKTQNTIVRLLAYPIYVLSFGFIDLAPRHYLIKRIIGLPSEKIEIINKRVFIDDMPLKEPWRVVHKDARTLSSSVNQRDSMSARIIPYNRYFVLGDNRDYNYDSRDFGVVHFSHIDGKVLR